MLAASMMRAILHKLIVKVKVRNIQYSWDMCASMEEIINFFILSFVKSPIN